MSGDCRFGDRCNFAHGEQELRSLPPRDDFGRGRGGYGGPPPARGGYGGGGRGMGGGYGGRGRVSRWQQRLLVQGQLGLAGSHSRI